MSVKQPFKVCTRCGDELILPKEQKTGECVDCLPNTFTETCDDCVDRFESTIHHSGLCSSCDL